MYSFANLETPILYYGVLELTHLLKLDPTTGMPVPGANITLSTPIIRSWDASQNFVASGHNKIMLFANLNMYRIDPPSGTVTDLGAMAYWGYATGESWASWGVVRIWLACGVGVGGGASFLLYAEAF